MEFIFYCTGLVLIGCIRQVIFSSSAIHSVWYALEVPKTEYLLDPGVRGGHWFADETPLSLRPPTPCISLVILTSVSLNCFCISSGLATRFSRCSKVAPLRFNLFGLLLGCEWRERSALDMGALIC